MEWSEDNIRLAITIFSISCFVISLFIVGTMEAIDADNDDEDL